MAFENAVRMVANLKMYIWSAIQAQEKVEHVITSFITDKKDSTVLNFKDINLNLDHRIEPILTHLKMQGHLQYLSFNNCGLGDHFLREVLSIIRDQMLPIKHLDLTQNDLTMGSMSYMASFLKDMEYI